MSKKLLQINPVLRTNTSTGRIMKEIGELAIANGWESYVAYSRGRDGLQSSTSIPVPVGDRCSVACHGLQTRLFDSHGLGSVRATERFIGDIRRIGPDIIHIHNIHGYF
ncbi:MAG: glycosyl transferase, partial [Candidatus Cryptobacteroides sp.]